MTSKKKHVYRVGDEIWVNKPRVVDRVGYPKSTWDYLPEDNDFNCHLAELLLTGFSLEHVLHIAEVNKLFPDKNFKSSYKTRNLASYLRAKEDGFGGTERSIHFKDLEYWSGCSHPEYDEYMLSMRVSLKNFKRFQAKVLSKRVVRTGTYFPPSKYYDSYEDYYECEPGGLFNVKSHVIINTDYGEFVEEDISPVEKE